MEEAATRIQSSYRGYQTRKLLRQPDATEADVGEDLGQVDVGEEDAVELDSPVPSLTEALADLTETVTKVALFLATPIEICVKPSVLAPADYPGGSDDGRGAAELEPDDVITAKEEGSVHAAPARIEDQQGAAECARHQPIADDQEGVFELFVQSDETTKDGLLECGWVQESARGQPAAWNQEDPLATCGVTVTVDACSDVEETESRDGDDWTDTSRSISPMSDEPCYQRAATKIQAGYRGYRTRKQLKRRRTPLPQAEAESDSDLDYYVELNDIASLHDTYQLENAAAIKIQAGYRGYRVRNEMKRARNNGPRWTRLHHRNSLSDSSSSISTRSQNRQPLDQDQAATKIQAGVRGFLVRRRQQKLRKHRGVQDRQGNVSDVKKTFQLPEDSQPLVRSSSSASERPEDSEPNRAAVKIQAAYRGYRVRHQLKDVADDVRGSGQVDEEKPIGGHRPQQTRKQVKTRKRF